MKVSWMVPQPGRLLSINETTGRTWQSTYKSKKVWEKAGWAHGIRIATDLHGLGVATPLTEPAMVKFQFSVPDKRRRDGHNLASTVCKWFIDGLVTANIFRDDDYLHLHLDDAAFTVEPPPNKNRMMRLSLWFGSDEGALIEKEFGP